MVLNDSLNSGIYCTLMDGGAPHIRLTIHNSTPVALSDFVANFVGIGNQFEKMIARDYPLLKAESEFFVKEVRAGSIEADLVTWIGTGAVAAVGLVVATADNIARAQAMVQFVKSLRDRLSPYFKPGGRAEGVSKGDLADFYKTVASVAHDPDGTLDLEAAVFEDGERKVRVGFKFNTAQAREAERQIAAHKIEMEASTDADHKRVLMRFVRPSIEPAKTHKPTGQRAIIEALHVKPLAVVYISDLAKERVTHEMTEAEGNIFRLLFDVDVNVEMVAGRPVAFRVMAVHDVNEMPDD